MKPPELPSLKFLDPLLGNRYFQFSFWTLVMGLVATIGIIILLRLGTLDSMELSLLDLKLRYRSDKIPGAHSAPDKNIVIVGIDEHTNKYIRTHPEMGLNSLTLPREMLAELLDYLRNKGAKAVIFDLEFKDPKPGDAKLAEAMRRYGTVFAADRMDYRLGSFIEEQSQLIATQRGAQRRQSGEIMFYEGMLAPYLKYQVQLKNRFLGTWAGPQDLGLGPIFHPLLLEDTLRSLSQNMNFEETRLADFRPRSIMSPAPDFNRHYSQGLYRDPVERVYSKLCTVDFYKNSYKNNPDFLKLLTQQSLHVNLSSPIPDEINQELTHCYTYPVANTILSALTSIGVPSIDYYDDAYIRSATVLYRGYKGNFYTYLGIRPALDLLGIQNIAYTPSALYLDERRIPLINDNNALHMDIPDNLARMAPWLADWFNHSSYEKHRGQKVLINWRNPRLLVEQLYRESGIDLKKNPELVNSLNGVTGDKNNSLLGGGHVYRLVSAIDLIRLAQGKKLSAEEEGRLYNIPFYPESGQFSFKDKIVIIGNTVTDIHRTPMSNTMFGPEVVAAVLDMFLHDNLFIEKPHPLLLWSAVAIMAVAIAASIVTFENLSIGFTVGIILVTLYWVLGILGFVYLGLWMDMLLPSFTLGFSLTAATLYRYYIHDQEKHHLTNVFSKYVSPQIMNEIVKNPEKALDNLKGGKKELTVLFSDLQGFTQLFEDADPEHMVSQLNEYFDVMTEIILNHGGTYDKYMGDSIMAFFGAPADVPDHAEMACRAAVEMQKALKYLNDSWAREGRKHLSHGVGISTGEMFVGNFGSKNIKNFTVMGSNVNLGARLEAFTRMARWPVIISSRTWELAKSQIRVRDLGLIQVKGFSEQVQVYGLESITGPSQAIIAQWRPDIPQQGNKSTG